VSGTSSFGSLVRHRHIAVVIPAFHAEKHIEGVLRSIPSWVRTIIVVDDCSPDQTGSLARRIGEEDARISVVTHGVNQGVGGAMRTGYQAALDRAADIVVKMDGDGQMDPAALPVLIWPILKGKADYAKGNRFWDLAALRNMPLVRRFGNTALSFMCKMVTGYWATMDPTNGYTAIHRTALASLPLSSIASTYFFECSMLINLNIIGAVVADVPMKARYGLETSSLSIRRTLLEFPPKLFLGYVRRLVVKKVLYDFAIDVLYLTAGVPFLLFGIVFGLLKWLHFFRLGVPAPAGTIMLAALPVILGFQLVLNAIIFDFMSVPSKPLSESANAPTSEGD
jgi:dolichol-phosphate mannosyltransferase